MKRQESLYSTVVVLITTASMALMIYLNGTSYRVDTEYIFRGDGSSSEEESQYTGYIFNDYNKKVNLGYTDKVPEKPTEDDIINTISLSGIGIENNTDSMRRIRSERIIEERELEKEYQDSRFQYGACSGEVSGN